MKSNQVATDGNNHSLFSFQQFLLSGKRQAIRKVHSLIHVEIQEIFAYKRAPLYYISLGLETRVSVLQNHMSQLIP